MKGSENPAGKVFPQCTDYILANSPLEALPLLLGYYFKSRRNSKVLETEIPVGVGDEIQQLNWWLRRGKKEEEEEKKEKEAQERREGNQEQGKEKEEARKIVVKGEKGN